jgi:NADH dehydrogenase
MIFVSGGSGFIGSHAVEKLMAAGHELRLMKCSGQGDKDAGTAERPGVEYVSGDICDSSSLAGKMDGCDTAINFVGIIIETRGATFENIHVNGVANLLEEAGRAGVGRFIHISALGTSDEPASEYFRTKRAAEKKIIASGIPYVILRPSLVCGPEDKFFNMLKPMLYSPIVPVVGTGKTRFQPIWVEDLASCVLEAVGGDAPLGGVWEVAGPRKMSFDEMLDVMSGVLGKAARPKIHIPVACMRPFAKLAESLLQRPPITTDQLKMLAIDNATDSDAIREIFGVDPRPLDEVLREYW